ncbi:MAG: hypothetical protein ABFS17_11140 [Chloroflexota bacterium]
MGTFTAQILIGHPHPNHGGINPTHFLFLSENSRPAWVLVNQNIGVEGEFKLEKVTWIPTPGNFLEDAILMIAIHVLKKPEILEAARKINPKIESPRVDLDEDLNEEQRTALYRACRELPNYYKLAISVFEESSLEENLSILEKYKMDVEVCKVTYSRQYSAWKKETRIEGSF